MIERAHPLQHVRQGQDPPKLAARKRYDTRQVLIALEQGEPLWIAKPAQAQMWKRTLQAMDGGQRVNDVTERTGLENQRRPKARQIHRRRRAHRPRARRSARTEGSPAAR